MMRYTILAVSVLSFQDVTSGHGHLVSQRSRHFDPDILKHIRTKKEWSPVVADQRLKAALIA